MRKDVFISYSSEDADIAFEILKGLEANGIACWIAPEGIDPGNIWADQIVHAIRDARIMIMILSPNLMQSRHTRRELVLADSEGLEIIPFRVKDCTIDDAWLYFLCDRHWRDACTPPMDMHVKDVSVAISSYLKSAEMETEAKARKFFQKKCRNNKWFEEGSIAFYDTLGPRLPVRIPGRINKKLDQPSRFIEAHQATIPLIGRQKEIDWLEEFRDSDVPFSWAVIKGEGGMGKSRLAFEFCRKCAEISWHSGVLIKSDLERFVNSPDINDWEICTPIFAVVDYAAAKVDLIIKLMSILSEAGFDEEDYPVRLLLLEREADRSEGWLHDLLESGEHDLSDTINDTFYKNEPLLLKSPSLDDSISPFGATRMIIESTMEAWSKHTDQPVPDKIKLTHEQWRRVQNATTNRPLYLQLAAIHTCEVNDPMALYHVNRTDLLKAAVDRELHYVTRQSSDSIQEAAINYITGLLCLTGLSVIRDRHWYECIENAMIEIGCQGLQPREVTQALELVFPNNFQEEDDLDRSAIQPDILAAAFCWEVFNREKAGFVNCCRHALDIGRARAWPKLIRLVQDLHGLEGYGNVAGQIEKLLEGDGRPLDELEFLGDYLPERSETLSNFGSRLYEILAEQFRNIDENKLKLARILVRWTTHLAFMNADPDFGIKVAHEAIDLLSDLTEKNWTELAPLLAGAYHYMASHLEDKENSLSEGLIKLDSAIEIRRKLYEAIPDRFTLDLADSLNNKSNNLAYQGMPEEALEVIEEAVELIEKLPLRISAGGSARIARYYNVKGRRLIELKRYPEANKPIEKSVVMRRELYHIDADVHAAPLLISLSNYRLIATQDKREEDAARILEEEISIAKDLCIRRPARFIDDYTSRVCLLAEYYLGRDLRGKMESLILEGNGHIIGNYSGMPTNEVGYAILKGCTKMATWLEDKNQFSLSLQVLDPALKLNRQIAQTGYFIPGVLEIMLRVLAKEQGLDPNKADDEVFMNWYTNRKESSSQAPDRAVAFMAHDLGLKSYSKKDFVLAKNLTAIAVDVYQKMITDDQNPDTLLSCVNSLNNLSFFEMKTGDIEKALVNAEYGISLIDNYTGYRIHEFADAEANILDTYAQALLCAGRIDKAAEIVNKSIRIYRDSIDDPQIKLGKEELILGLFTQGRVNSLQGRVESAFKSFIEGLNLTLTIENPMSEHRKVAFRDDVLWAIDAFKKWGQPLPDHLVEPALMKLKETDKEEVSN